MIYYDNHLHSQFSPDSRMSLGQAAETAAALDLGGISVTDHLDLDAPRSNDEFIFDIREQQSAIGSMREKYPGIKIFKGIEVGLQPGSIEKTRSFISGHNFDIIIASIHFIDGEDPYYGDYYNGKGYKEAYGRALEIMYRTAVEFKDFDVLGHFDYIARYAPYDVREIRYSEFGDRLDPLLNFLAKEGKAFEINTNTYRERNGHIPELDTAILKRFRELGGEALSLGSDAHDKIRIAENFKTYSEVALRCGFRYIVHFEERRPCYTAIS